MRKVKVWNRVIGFCLVFVFWSLVIPPEAAQAAVPQYITFQGRLTGADIPASDTVTKTLTLQLYDAAVAGNLVGAAITKDISIIDTIFTAEIPIPAGFTFPAEYWVGIKVGADPEMTPRQHLTSVPYAFRAGVADTLAGNLYVRKAGDEMTGPLNIRLARIPEQIGLLGLINDETINGVGVGGGSGGGGLTSLVAMAAHNKVAVGGATTNPEAYAGWFSGGKGVRVEGDVEIVGDTYNFKKNGVVIGAGGGGGGVPDPIPTPADNTQNVDANMDIGGSITVGGGGRGSYGGDHGGHAIHVRYPGTTQSGYIGFQKSDGSGGWTRLGYIGWDPTDLKINLENSAKLKITGGEVNIDNSQPHISLLDNDSSASDKWNHIFANNGVLNFQPSEGRGAAGGWGPTITFSRAGAVFPTNAAVGGAAVDENTSLKAQFTGNTNIYGKMGESKTTTTLGITTTSKMGAYGQSEPEVRGVLGLYSSGPLGTNNYGVFGRADGSEGSSYGVHGISNAGIGVYGVSITNTGIYGKSRSGKMDGSKPGVYGLNNAAEEGGPGVFGENQNDNGPGVKGRGSPGVFGLGSAEGGVGVQGNATYIGVRGESNDIGVKGISQYRPTGSYLMPTGDHYAGISGKSVIGVGVYGSSESGTGIAAWGRNYDFYAEGPGTNWGSASSIRWKENVRLIDKPLEKVLSLRGVYFDWKKDRGGKHDIGLIAEEVGKVLPEVVGYETDGSGYATGMDYSKLTPLLVEAIKEQQKEIEVLKAEIKELKAKAK